MPNSDRLFEEADIRGLTVRPRGKGTELILPDGTKRIFEDELEAMEAVQRIPIVRTDASLEEVMEREMNWGIENSFDSDVDAGAFLPASVNEAVMQQVVRGGAPLAEMRTTDVGMFLNAFEAMTGDIPKNRKIGVRILGETAEEGETLKGGAPDAGSKIVVRNKGKENQSIEIKPKPGAKPTRLAVYDEDLMNAKIVQLSSELERLGVNTQKGVEKVLDDLDRVPHGMRILSTDDPESAVMYSWFRQHSMKGNWEQGEVAMDMTGPHRRFTPEQKKQFSFRVC
jgi:hypothetical protein